jgi:DNA gyrase inhibitor GyrI
MQVDLLILNQGEKMNKLDVHIVRLKPMNVVSAYGFGASPEGIAHDKMLAFLKSKNMLDGYGTKYRHFGFNNPNPAPGSPNYGYEIWVEVEKGIDPDGDVRIEHFPGGLYAVTRFENLENIGRVWCELAQWREASKYKEANHQWLENLLNPLETDGSKYIFDLYLPISE